MYRQLFFLYLIASANGVTFWEVLLGSVTTLVGGISYFYAPPGQEDAFLNISQIAGKYGYPLETHTLITEDGYILNMHRIPHGRNVTSNGQAVFLMHGIWESSDSWILQGPDKALAYILANQGYDVWMGNARGNRHSLNHKIYKANEPKFWEFSWEEIGLYDLPAMIDYVLETTGEKSLYYIGFSQGTTSYFVMNSMRPEYNGKIKVMFALAPEVFLGNAKNILLRIFSPAHAYLKLILWNFNIYSPSTDFFNSITPFICKLTPVNCENLFVSVIGPHNVNKDLWPVILGHVPTGCSTLQFIHYGQIANSKRFCRFDFGVNNIKKYGQLSPPDYDLTAVTSPVVIFHSGNDWFSDRKDVEILKTKLKNVTAAYYVKQFSHVDFMYADESSTLVYSNIVNQIQKRP